MRRLILLLCILVFVPPCESRSEDMQLARLSPAMVGGGVPAAAPSYLFQENFEGTGYENSWTESGAGTRTINEDYTTTVLRGSQSLYLDATATDGLATSYTDYIGQDELWFFFRIRRIAAHDGPDIWWLNLTDSGDNSVLLLYIDASDDLWLYVTGWGQHAGPASQKWTLDTTFYIWGYYKKGTGANAEAWVKIDTDNTIPVSNSLSVTNGTSTADAARIRFRCQTAADVTSWGFIVDQVIVHDSAIGDVAN